MHRPLPQECPCSLAPYPGRAQTGSIAVTRIVPVAASRTPVTLWIKQIVFSSSAVSFGGGICILEIGGARPLPTECSSPKLLI